MGADSWADRENEALKLLNFGFRNFEVKEVCVEGQGVTTVPVDQGKQDAVDALATRSVYVTVFKHDPEGLNLIKDTPASVPAPVAKGASIGTLRILVDGKELHTVELVAKAEVKKSLLAYWRIGLGILGALVVIALIMRLSRKKQKPAISG
jgi:D-alanyl-D-alanine carboxypeptidase (penicillin-binding protein 5/6)